MMIEPRIVERVATYYAAVAAEVVMPFDEAIGPLMDEAEDYLKGTGKPYGLALFRYDVVDMPRLEMQFGFVTPEPVEGNGRVRPGVLPVGRYATVTYVGPYDDLENVTGHIIRWATANGIEWDSIKEPGGERFASRIEIYLNGPMDEPDPQKYATEIWIKVRD